MPVANPLHRIIAKKVLTDIWVCRNCYARNPVKARRCRKQRCRSTNLRPKKKDK
ncbi:MAG: 50S ribosomal protein L40e [Candidatus Heimdallarchaeota archaeon]|nr:50S ribosomal protein L40e [Candidatus Heimdallarchaeota archaeon]MDH5646100.1 50S ribosomal protein L40e [Candidatus Heimdallarchaeota archaeon]